MQSGVSVVVVASLLLFSCASGEPEGCSRDEQCYSPRVCVQRACVDPKGSGGGSGQGGSGIGGGSAQAGGGAGGGSAQTGGGAGGGGAQPSSKKLAVPFVPQMTQVWCWAACSQMVAAYAGNDVAQCTILSKWFNAPCCTNYQACATPGSLGMIQTTIVAESGWNSRAVPSAISFEQFRAQIDREKPVIISYSGSFAGHVVVGFGYDSDARTIDVHDPNSGTWTVSFAASFRYGSMANSLNWTSTILDFGVMPAFCCTPVGRLGPFPNTTIPAGAACSAMDSVGVLRYGNACF